MGTYLEDHPNLTKKQYRYPRQSHVTGAIVLHDAECNPQFKLNADNAAESVAKFISIRSDAGSYHSIVDSDSICRVCRYEWEAYHEGTGGNRWSLGLSFACKTNSWDIAPPWWIDAILTNGAREAFNMAMWIKSTTGIIVPAERISAEDYRSGRPGFVAHGQLDPTRRTDPGKTFPWMIFLDKFRRLMAMTDLDRIAKIEAFQRIDYTYRERLHRTASEGEMAYWMGQVEKDGLDAVITAIKGSPEAIGR